MKDRGPICRVLSSVPSVGQRQVSTQAGDEAVLHLHHSSTHSARPLTQSPRHSLNFKVHEETWRTLNVHSRT